MGKEIDEKTLKEAKEKLACKIEPATYGDGSSSGASSRRPSSATALPTACACSRSTSLLMDGGYRPT